MNEQPAGALLRQVDFAARAAKGGDQRYDQDLIDGNSGGTSCMVHYFASPANSGPVPTSLHIHDFDQMLYMISGTMSVEVGGEIWKAGPGSLVVLPKGVPHRNWNEGPEETVHLSINSPSPTRTNRW